MSLFDRVVAFEEKKHGVKFKIKVDSIYIKLLGSAGIFNRLTKTIHVKSSSSFFTLLHEMGHSLTGKISYKEALRDILKRSVIWAPFPVLAVVLTVLGLPTWCSSLVIAIQWAFIFAEFFFGYIDRIFGEPAWRLEREHLADRFATEELLDLVEKGFFVDTFEVWRKILSVNGR